MNDNVFARIARKEIPVEILYENEHVLAFRDIAPQAPVHVLIIPKKEIEKVTDLEDGDQAMLGAMVLAARDLAKKLGLREGFRLVMNEGEQGGQSVSHLHLHLLGGRDFSWPPG